MVRDMMASDEAESMEAVELEEQEPAECANEFG